MNDELIAEERRLLGMNPYKNAWEQYGILMAHVRHGIGDFPEDSEVAKLRKWYLREQAEGLRYIRFTMGPEFNGTAEDLAAEINHKWLDNSANNIVSRIENEKEIY